jgi:PadR family transcriptional regulator PadR
MPVSGYADGMNEIRMTAIVGSVMDVLANMPPGAPAWGLVIRDLTGYPGGSVYPALGRLLDAGWVTDQWERPLPEDRPPRRFYVLTPAGRAGYQAAEKKRSQLIAAARRLGAATESGQVLFREAG